ncbi:MAG: hypothetical protein K6T83_12405 [Alicyclobacillus sp.]|nr:hypothetical protein [Alicyclobacillus sp.]
MGERHVEIDCVRDRRGWHAHAGAGRRFQWTHSKVLSGAYEAADEPLIRQMLAHWNVTTLDDLRNAVTHVGTGFTSVDWPHVGQFAPFVTEAARQGSPLAMRVCENACEQIATGVRLVGGHFQTERIPVAFIGGVIRSPFMRAAARRRVEQPTALKKTFTVLEPELSRTAGAVLMALAELGISLTDAVRENLRTAVIY